MAIVSPLASRAGWAVRADSNQFTDLGFEREVLRNKMVKVAIDRIERAGGQLHAFGPCRAEDQNTSDHD